MYILSNLGASNFHLYFNMLIELQLCWSHGYSHPSPLSLYGLPLPWIAPDTRCYCTNTNQLCNDINIISAEVVPQIGHKRQSKEM